MTSNVRLFFGSKSVTVPTEGVVHEHTMTETWITNAETQYNAVMEVMAEISASGIPFFLSTDQHGRTLTQHCWVANTDQTIKNINLGDTMNNYDVDIIQRVIDETSNLPNIISVPGNHEFHKNTTDPELYPTTYNAINSAFAADGIRQYNRYGYGSVVDESRNVKWLIIQPYAIDLNTDAGFTTKLGTGQARWLIRELSVNDGYDIVLLKHAPLSGDFVDRDGKIRTSTDGNHNGLDTVLQNRVSGTAGTYTDSDGVAHTYDFSNLDGELLGMLHGHLHQEVWKIENGLTAYCADTTARDMSCIFGVFDRRNKKLRIWKFDNTAVYDELIMDIGLA